MNKILGFFAALTMILSLNGCTNHMSESDPIQTTWVSNNVNGDDLRTVLNFESETHGQMWYEKDKKLNGTKTMFIYTRSQTELTLLPNPVGGEGFAKVSYKINSLSSTTLSLTSIETEVTQVFTRR